MTGFIRCRANRCDGSGGRLDLRRGQSDDALLGNAGTVDRGFVDGAGRVAGDNGHKLRVEFGADAEGVFDGCEPSDSVRVRPEAYVVVEPGGDLVQRATAAGVAVAGGFAETPVGFRRLLRPNDVEALQVDVRRPTQAAHRSDPPSPIPHPRSRRIARSRGSSDAEFFNTLLDHSG